MTLARDIAVKMARRQVGDLVSINGTPVVTAHWTVHDCYAVASAGTVHVIWENTTGQWFYCHSGSMLTILQRAALLLSPTAKLLDAPSKGALLSGGYPALVKRRLQTGHGV
ncbi:MAG: hypothetical protein Q9M13_07865 [Mariprofundales bacterium]|nr:hypothetical protein [Mariprofundales bacterium]